MESTEDDVAGAAAATQSPPRQREFTFAALPHELQAARMRIAAALAQDLAAVGAAELLSELTLALDEALNNALEHGAASVARVAAESPSAIRVLLETTPRLWRATVRDPGHGFDLLAVPPPDALAATGGFGIALLRSIVSRLSSRRLPDGHELLLERVLISPPRAPVP